MGLAAGAAELDITPEPGGELMGYGARRGVSTGVHDRLFARALYLREETASAEMLLLSADLCLIATEQARVVRQAIAGRTPLAPEQILVGCTHTHSGPDTGLAALIAGREPPTAVSRLLDQLVETGVRAVESARPARAGWACAETEIGRNRRIEGGPIDSRVLILRVCEEKGAPLAVLFHHGCHGTVLGHDNLELSADWPGVAASALARETGAIALFLLGSHADIDPRTRPGMDLAIPGQSVGLGHDAVRVLGMELAHAVLEALDGAPLEKRVPLASARRFVELPLHLGDRPEAQARRELERRKRELAELLGTELEEFPRLSQLQGFAEHKFAELPPREARRRLSLVRLYLRDKTGPFFVAGRQKLDVEAQLLRIGDAALLALPLEPTTNVGLDWQRRVPLPHAGVVGIANGWLRYLPHTDDFAHPSSCEHYEILQSTFIPEACERLLQSGEALIRSRLL